MVKGLGSDVIEIERVATAIERQGDKFIRRVLSERECAIASNYQGRRLAEFVSGRFAAKEAISKAVGCGIGQLSMASVTIEVGSNGLQATWKHPSALMDMFGEGDQLLVSISHSETVAFAVAMWQSSLS